MPLDSAVHRVVGRYRFMFRTALCGFASSVALMLWGVVLAIYASSASLLAFSMILMGISGLNAYLAARSTVKILDAHPDERRVAEAAARRMDRWV